MSTAPETMIHVRGLSKRFKMYRGPYDRLAEWIGLGNRHTDFWALRDFNLEVKAGECVGVIGPNGAGKSTLLKILSGTLSPTSGEFDVRGKILSLLELGTGFNPELTGEQNVLDTSSLLGFPANYVRERLADIENFAGIGDFFQRPIKTYSSGMSVRLAFSMFVFLDPDVLIVDEALAVGDAAFQRKCYRRIEDMVTNEKRAVLIVSHDTNAIIRFCTKAVWLERGQTQKYGAPQEVIEAYLRHMFSQQHDGEAALASASTAKSNQASAAVESATPTPASIPTSDKLLPRSQAAVVYPSDGATMLGVWLESADGRVLNTVPVDTSFFICYGARFHRECDGPTFGIRVTTIRGEVLLATNSRVFHRATKHYKGDQVEIVRWPVASGLSPGNYFVSCGISTEDEPPRFLFREVDAYELIITGAAAGLGPCNIVGPPQLTSE